MAEEVKKDVIIDIVVKNDEAISNIAAAQKEIDALRAKNVELKNSFGDNSEAIAQNNETIKALNDTIRANSKEIQNNIKQQKSNEDSVSSMRAQLGNLLKEYDNLSKAEREGAKGKEMMGHINDLTDNIKKANFETQRFRDNVGNYPQSINIAGLNIAKLSGIMTQATGGVNTLSAGFRGGVNAVSAFGKQLLSLLANPIVAIIAAIAVVVMQLVEALKRNDDSATKLQASFSALQPIVTALKAVFNALSEVVASVVNGMAKAVTAVLGLIPGYKDAAKAAEELTYAQDLLEDKEREYTVEHAKNDKKVSEIRDKASQKEKYSAEERKKMLEEAMDIEKKDAVMKKNLAIEKYNLALRQQKQDQDFSDERKSELAQLQAAMYNAEKEYYEKDKALQKQYQSAIKQMNAEAEAARKEHEQKAKEWAEKRKERQNKELSERRALAQLMVDVMDEGQKKEEEATRLSYNNKIEDLKKRLKEEKNINKATREAINQEIIILSAQLQVELGKIKEKYGKDNAEKEFARLEANAKRELELIGNNYDKNLEIQLQQLEREKQVALTEAAKNGEDVLLVEKIYEQKKKELAINSEREKWNAVNAEAELKIAEMNNQFEREMQAVEGNEEMKTKLAYEQAQKRYEIVKNEYDRINSLNEEQQIVQYGSVHQWEMAVAQADSAVIQANANVIASYKAMQERTKANYESVGGSLQSLMGSMQSMFQTMADSDEKYAGFAKGIAMTQILISSAISIAKAVQAATESGAATGPGAFVTTPVFIAELVAIVGSAIASAVGILKQADSGVSKPTFATGGYVSGAGTGTSDSIDAKLSNGEFVVNASSTRKYLPALLAMNGGWGNTGGRSFSSGGMVSYDAMMGGYNSQMISETIQQSLQNIRPVVSVKEITRVQKRIQSKELTSKI